MATLAIFNEDNTTYLNHSEATITLARVGVTLGKATEVDFFMSDFFIHDIIELDGNKDQFLTEHFHLDVEARWFIEGGGDFYVHFGKPVYKIMCQTHDYIIIPAGLRHWFNMGTNSYAKVFRGFHQNEGWVAHNTDSEIYKQYINRR
jgi:cupin superfamily acireductone dioxygenase involved in methionine salvage